ATPTLHRAATADAGSATDAVAAGDTSPYTLVGAVSPPVGTVTARATGARRGLGRWCGITPHLPSRRPAGPPAARPAPQATRRALPTPASPNAGRPSARWSAPYRAAV